MHANLPNQNKNIIYKNFIIYSKYTLNYYTYIFFSSKNTNIQKNITF